MKALDRRRERCQSDRFKVYRVLDLMAVIALYGVFVVILLSMCYFGLKNR